MLLKLKVATEWFRAENPSIPMWRFIPVVQPSSLRKIVWLTFQVLQSELFLKD